MGVFEPAIGSVLLHKHPYVKTTGDTMTGDLGITKTVPEYRLTTSGDSEYSRVKRIVTASKAARYNRVVAPGYSGGGTTGNALHTIDTNTAYAACAVTHSEFGVTTGDFTIEAWVYPHLAGGDEKFVSTFLNGSPYTGWLLCVDADGYPAFRFYDGNWQKIKGTGIWQVNTWYHVAFTYDESTTTGTIYVNGTSVGTNAAFPAPHYSTGDILQFGRASNEAGYYHGLIQNVRISNNIRYTGSSFTPSTDLFVPDANTLGLWWCNDDLTDKSTNNLPLVYQGSGSAVYGTGTLKIPTGGTEVEALVWSSEDGVASTEQGIQTFGHSLGKTIIDGSSILTKNSIIPDSDSTYDLGSSTPKYWANGYFDRIVLNSTATLDGTIAGTVNTVGNLQIEDNLTPTKGYRFRTNGGSLDCEAAGADWYISNWQNAGYSGTQRTYLVFKSSQDAVSAYKYWEFKNGSDQAWITINPGNGFVVNEQGESIDTRMEGDTDVNLLFLDASADMVGIGTASPGSKLTIAGDIDVSGVYKVDTIQVVGNRIVDDRIDDTINTTLWDATTAGVLDAIRDACITHGLIAAA